MYAESLRPLIDLARSRARETRRVWYVPWGATDPTDVTLIPNKRDARYAVRPNGAVEFQHFEARINGFDPGWGVPYGGDGPHWRTDKGILVTMFRKGQAVRFYDQRGNQVGPEQRNVTPAVAYALQHRWEDFDEIAKGLVKENQEGLVMAGLVERVASRYLLAATIRGRRL